MKKKKKKHTHTLKEYQRLEHTSKNRLPTKCTAANLALEVVAGHDVAGCDDGRRLEGDGDGLSGPEQGEGHGLHVESGGSLYVAHRDRREEGLNGGADLGRAQPAELVQVDLERSRTRNGIDDNESTMRHGKDAVGGLNRKRTREDERAR
jgi:hypothetical protein